MIDKILNEYEDFRAAAEFERKNRIKAVYKKFPRIEEIDKEIFSAGSKNMQDILQNPENGEELNREFKKHLNLLRTEKEKIMKENKIDADYDKVRYRCKLCRDTGYTEDGKRCLCLKQRLINEAYMRSNLGEMLKSQNFGNFSFDYYSKQSADGEISPYENMKNIYKRAENFCRSFDRETKSLLFYGKTGLGKTFLSSCIAKELMDSGKTVIYTRASRLFAMYDDYKFGRSADRTLLDEVYVCDLLIIDDLGTEPINSISKGFLFDIVNERTADNKKMIINTNLDLGELTNAYSQRFTSRIFEFFMTYKFTGSDIRIQQATK